MIPDRIPFTTTPDRFPKRLGESVPSVFQFSRPRGELFMTKGIRIRSYDNVLISDGCRLPANLFRFWSASNSRTYMDLFARFDRALTG